MAKLTNTPTPEAIEAIEAIGVELVEKLGDQFFTLEGTPTLPVKYPNGSYKQKPLLAGWEYKLENVFVGTRGKPVFQFSPEDAQEYDFVDIYMDKLDDILPLFGPAFAQAFGIEDLDSPPAIMKRVVEERLNAEAQAAVKAEEEAKQAFSANPLFGRFG